MASLPNDEGSQSNYNISVSQPINQFDDNGSETQSAFMTPTKRQQQQQRMVHKNSRSSPQGPSTFVGYMFGAVGSTIKNVYNKFTSPARGDGTNMDQIDNHSSYGGPPIKPQFSLGQNNTNGVIRSEITYDHNRDNRENREELINTMRTNINVNNNNGQIDNYSNNNKQSGYQARQETPPKQRMTKINNTRIDVNTPRTRETMSRIDNMHLTTPKNAHQQHDTASNLQYDHDQIGNGIGYDDGRNLGTGPPIVGEGIRIHGSSASHNVSPSRPRYFDHPIHGHPLRRGLGHDYPQSVQSMYDSSSRGRIRSRMRINRQRANSIKRHKPITVRSQTSLTRSKLTSPASKRHNSNTAKILRTNTRINNQNNYASSLQPPHSSSQGQAPYSAQSQKHRQRRRGGRKRRLEEDDHSSMYGNNHNTFFTGRIGGIGASAASEHGFDISFDGFDAPPAKRARHNHDVPRLVPHIAWVDPRTGRAPVWHEIGQNGIMYPGMFDGKSKKPSLSKASTEPVNLVGTIKEDEDDNDMDVSNSNSNANNGKNDRINKLSKTDRVVKTKSKIKKHRRNMTRPDDEPSSSDDSNDGMNKSNGNKNTREEAIDSGAGASRMAMDNKTVSSTPKWGLPPSGHTNDQYSFPMANGIIEKSQKQQDKQKNDDNNGTNNFSQFLDNSEQQQTNKQNGGVTFGVPFGGGGISFGTDSTTLPLPTESPKSNGNRQTTPIGSGNSSNRGRKMSRKRGRSRSPKIQLNDDSNNNNMMANDSTPKKKRLRATPQKSNQISMNGNECETSPTIRDVSKEMAQAAGEDENGEGEGKGQGDAQTQAAPEGEKKSEGKKKGPVPGNCTYIMKVMMERKDRQSKEYKRRITRIWGLENPDLVPQWNAKIERYNYQYHPMYERVCKKYGYIPLAEYDGQDHPNESAIEEKIQAKKQQKTKDYQNGGFTKIHIGTPQKKKKSKTGTANNVINLNGNDNSNDNNNNNGNNDGGATQLQTSASSFGNNMSFGVSQPAATNGLTISNGLFSSPNKSEDKDSKQETTNTDSNNSNDNNSNFMNGNVKDNKKNVNDNDNDNKNEEKQSDNNKGASIFSFGGDNKWDATPMTGFDFGGGFASGSNTSTDTKNTFASPTKQTKKTKDSEKQKEKEEEKKDNVQDGSVMPFGALPSTSMLNTGAGAGTGGGFDGFNGFNGFGQTQQKNGIENNQDKDENKDKGKVGNKDNNNSNSGGGQIGFGTSLPNFSDTVATQDTTFKPPPKATTGNDNSVGNGQSTFGFSSFGNNDSGNSNKSTGGQKDNGTNGFQIGAGNFGSSNTHSSGSFGTFSSFGTKESSGQTSFNTNTMSANDNGNKNGDFSFPTSGFGTTSTNGTAGNTTNGFGFGGFNTGGNDGNNGNNGNSGNGSNAGFGTGNFASTPFGNGLSNSLSNGTSNQFGSASGFNTGGSGAFGSGSGAFGFNSGSNGNGNPNPFNAGNGGNGGNNGGGNNGNNNFQSPSGDNPGFAAQNRNPNRNQTRKRTVYRGKRRKNGK